MTSPRLGLRIVALALAAPAACAIENPAFMFDPDTGTGTGTTNPTSTTTSSSSTTTSTTDASTDTRPTSTTVATLPSDTTTADVSTGEDTTPVSSTSMALDNPSDCVETEIILPSEADGFYIAGGTLGGTTCNYPDDIGEKLAPCKDLNFGLSPEMRIARGAKEFEAMYVVRFPKLAFTGLSKAGVTSATAELGLNVYAPPTDPIDLRIGMIKDQWVEGNQKGAIALEGDSSFAAAVIGIKVTQWSDPTDGPRGSSDEVMGIFPVSNDYPNHSYIESDNFPIDQWLAAPDLAEGLVVSFVKDDALGSEGPSIHTRDFEDANAHPYLRVHYCKPQP